MVEISFGNLVKLNRLASIGRLIGGLIHNLNGPLQNLGMDLEMMDLSLSREGNKDEDFRDKIAIRLQRMTHELDNIILQIKTTSTKASVFEEKKPSIDLNQFLQQELDFLKADLYFKHNVETVLELEDNAPLLSDLPEEVPISLSWFLQGLAEELAKEDIRKLGLRSILSPPYHEIILTTEDKRLASGFCALLELDGSPLKKLLGVTGEDENLGMRVAMYCLKQSGGRLRCINEDSRSTVNLQIPLSVGEASE